MTLSEKEKRDIVCLTASQGGIEALRIILGSLRADIAAAIFIVMHIGRHRSILPEILSKPSVQ